MVHNEQDTSPDRPAIQVDPLSSRKLTDDRLLRKLTELGLSEKDLAVITGTDEQGDAIFRGDLPQGVELPDRYIGREDEQVKKGRKFHRRPDRSGPKKR